MDIGRALVGLGFATTAPLSAEITSKVDNDFLSYHAQLKSSERRARSLRKGMWSQVPEMWIRWYLRTGWDKLIFKLKPAHLKLPALVR